MTKFNSKNPLRWTKKSTLKHPIHQTPKGISVDCFECQKILSKKHSKSLQCTHCGLYCLEVSGNQEFSSYYCGACMTHWKVTEDW
jgi:hypothetical protein